MVLGVEHRRVAVGIGERFGDGALREPGDLVEHGAHGVGVEIAVAARVQNLGQVQDFEQVELDVTNVGDVVAHGFSLHAGKLQRSVPDQGKRTQP